MDLSPNSVTCFRCFLQPYNSTALIFGAEVFDGCSCEIPSYYNSLIVKYKGIYFQFVEFVLWEDAFINILGAIPEIDKHMPCAESLYKMVGDDLIFLKVAMVCLSSVVAFSFSWIKKKKKIPSHLNILNLSNADKINLSNQFQIIWVALLSLDIFFNIVFLYLNVVTISPSFSPNGSNFKTLFCSVEGLFWSILQTGIIIHFCQMIFIFVMIFIKGFQRMAGRLYFLQSINSNLEYELEILMVEHDNLWTCYNDLISIFEFPLTLIYSGALLSVCLGFYGLVFVEMNRDLKYVTLFIVLYGGLGCILCGFVISKVIAAMQNSFQDIRRFAECDFRLEFKLKILNFMKRFGKESLGTCLCGYISVTKNFPVKVASSLHSIFDSLLNLRSAEDNKITCKSATVTNATNSF